MSKERRRGGRYIVLPMAQHITNVLNLEYQQELTIIMTPLPSPYPKELLNGTIIRSLKYFTVNMSIYYTIYL
ncbi:hypothetical protein SK128_002050 [Halocaridina rubra]|uniref:Uncharacterized protein n=1 Tax=Halocaridina rubra TaxID=373956 RepID=A0AAN8X2V2_HALRR